MRDVQIEKPRLFQSSKDILMTLGVLLFAMFLTVGFTGLCSFDPGPADRSGPVQEIDKDAILQMDARGLAFPIRNPDMPEGWVPNSARRTMVGQSPSSLVGWVVNGEHYISLTQTDADFDDAIAIGEFPREQSGSFVTNGVEWVQFTGEDVRPLWVADLGDVRLMLEGMATVEQMEIAAEVVSKTAPIADAADTSVSENEAGADS